MDKSKNLKAFAEIYSLLNYYYEHRDHPAPEGFNFSKELEYYCNQLNIDLVEFKKEFDIL